MMTPATMIGVSPKNHVSTYCTMVHHIRCRFRNEELFLKIGRFKISKEQLVVDRWPWPKMQNISGFSVNVFPPLKKVLLVLASFQYYSNETSI